jgi:hypothetical protein
VCDTAVSCALADDENDIGIWYGRGVSLYLLRPVFHRFM